MTDDARIVDAGGCQIESFVKRQLSIRELETWFLPACNLGGNLEVTAGALRVAPSPQGTSTIAIVQGKTLVKPVTEGSLGLGFSAGSQALHLSRPRPSGRREGYIPYVNGIGSWSVARDAIVFHGNLGCGRDLDARKDLINWGLGAEIRVATRLFAIVEGYQVSGTKPAQQIGVRWRAIPNRLRIDGTVG